MKDSLVKVLLSTSVLLAGLAMTSVYAQSTGGGLKLGQPETATEGQTLDLGAAPAVDPQDPPPQPAQSQGSASPPAASGSEPIRMQHGAWELACAPNGSDCAMAQIGNDETGTPVLEMVVRKLDEPMEIGERTAYAVLDIITPLGVVLPEGVTMTIDAGREEAALFQICTEQGCLVREPVDNDLIGRLKRGNSAVIGVVAASKGKVSASLSLSGFTKAYDSM